MSNKSGLGSENNNSMAASYLKELIKESCDSEQKRYESLIDTSNRLLTSESILTAALSVVISMLIDGLEGNLNQIIILFSAIVLGLVVLSLMFCLIAQWRWKHELLASPLELKKYVSETMTKLTNEYAIAEDHSETLEKVFRTVVRKNDKISICIKLSIVSMVGALALFLVLLVLALIV